MSLKKPSFIGCNESKLHSWNTLTNIYAVPSESPILKSFIFSAFIYLRMRSPVHFYNFLSSTNFLHSFIVWIHNTVPLFKADSSIWR